MIPAIAVALLPRLLPSDWAAKPAVAVVIDTLRFTSTACVALANHARAVTVLSDIQQARQLAAASPAPLKALLCGERDCIRIDGFDLGNSPAEYDRNIVAGRELIFSTTNGTVAVEKAQAAQALALGSLLNRHAVCQWLADQIAPQLANPLASSASHPSSSPTFHPQVDQPNVWLICAGTDGEVACEDVLTAGAIIDRLDWSTANDSAALARSAWRSLADRQALLDQLRQARGGRNLIDSGFQSDVAAVADVDSLSCVPCRTAPGRFEALDRCGEPAPNR
ncbi:MAG: 2-phosphosulfolactate phosphatase [Pirellulaceae bacterium]|nr:2-phosphosulfolactate phosphatase [Pirellulaceae bacterium]